jgi:hypothetical protein
MLLANIIPPPPKSLQDKEPSQFFLSGGSVYDRLESTKVLAYHYSADPLPLILALLEWTLFRRKA